jgi:hypothetical protein
MVWRTCQSTTVYPQSVTALVQSILHTNSVKSQSIWTDSSSTDRRYWPRAHDLFERRFSGSSRTGTSEPVQTHARTHARASPQLIGACFKIR